MEITIKALYRASSKFTTNDGKDTFHTFEYGEERTVNVSTEEEYETEKKKLWNAVSNEVAKQIRETSELYKR